MKIVIVDDDGKRHQARQVESGQFVVIDRCPSCGSAGAAVVGTGITHHDHDTYYAKAVARCCSGRIGTIETTVSTIFGIDEDERVLHGRPRVY